MAPIIETLASRLKLVSWTFTGAVAPWQAWLDEPLAISPWQAWTLLGLIRHRPRQQFVHEVVVERLQGDLAALAKEGPLLTRKFPSKALCWDSANQKLRILLDAAAQPWGPRDQT